MIDCIIIEDEPLATDKLVNYISKLPYLNLLTTFNSATSASEYLQLNNVDLIFLDIEMKDLTGIQFLESVKVGSRVIITTAYEQYAIKGFDLQVSDYLLKPITFERFARACDKVNREFNQAGSRNRSDRIFVKTEYRLEGIDLSEILFIEGMGDYRRIITTSKKIMTLQSFGELYDLLPKDKFCRVHNSYIVSMDKIEKIERNRIRIKEHLIPISDSYSKEFYSKLNK